jgi:hypothetical protein
VADKVQNINVNYNFRTTGAEQARVAAENIKKATENLGQAAQDSGQRISNAYRASQQSIASMQIQLARLKTQVELASDPKKVKQLSDQYKELKSRLDAATKSAFDQAKAIKEIGNQASNTNKGINSLGTALAAAFSVAAVKQIADTALNLALVAGNAEGVQRAFNRAFADAPLLLDDLRKATHGTLTDVQLMQKTLQATNLGVSVEGLATLFEFAAARAQQTGESVDYLVNSIVSGIGRKSIRLIDNLGISAVDLTKELGGVSAATADVAQVTEAVSNIVQRELVKMGGFAETSATKVEKIKVAFEEVTIEAGNAFNRFEKFFQDKTGLPGFLSSLELAAKGMQAFFKANGNAFKFGDELLKMENEAIALQDAQRVRQKALTDESLKDQQKKQDFIQQEINSRVQIINTYQEEARQNADRLKLLKKSADGSLALREQAKLYNRENEVINHTIGETNILNTRGSNLRLQLVRLAEEEIPRLQAQNGALKNNEQIVKQTVDLLVTYLDKIEDTTKGEKEQLGIIQLKRQEIDAIQEAIEKTRKLSDLSSRRSVGTLVSELAVAQAQLNELLAGGPADPKIKIDLKKPITDAIKDFENQIEPVKIPGEVVLVPPSTGIIPKDFMDNLQEAFEEARDELIQSGIDLTTDLIKSTEEAELASLQFRINATRNFYDEQQILAGDNERAKAQLRLKEEKEISALQKKMAEKERSVRRFNVVIDTAASIAKTAAQLGFPAAIPFIALAAAQGVAQLAIINKTPARFAKGVLNLQGPGTETSDSIPSLLSKGESVMTASETRRSMGLLDAIKKNKIDDRVLKQLHVGSQGITVIPWDNAPVVEAIKSNRQPSFAKQGRILLEVHEDSKGNKRYIRSKSI